MQMSNSEIIRRWKNGAYKPKEMVKVIADLNGCREQDIVRVLFVEGELTGQAIYHYRKSGKLDCTDEEVELYAKPVDRTPNEGKTERKADKTERKAKVEKMAQPPRIPKAVRDIAEELLSTMAEEYEAAKKTVSEYEELKAWLDGIGG